MRFRIGSGAGFSGDRLEPAVILAEQGDLDYLGLECLAERTIALAQLRRRADPTQGYDPLLKRRVEMLLPVLKRRGVRLISNFGAANPLAGADTRGHNQSDRLRGCSDVKTIRNILKEYGYKVEQILCFESYTETTSRFGF